MIDGVVSVPADGVVTAISPTDAVSQALSIGPRFLRVGLAPLYSGAYQIRGLYAAGTTYAANDIVATDGVAAWGGVYRSKAGGNIGNTPSTSPAQWELLADDQPRRAAVLAACAYKWPVELAKGLWTSQSAVETPGGTHEILATGYDLMQAAPTNGVTYATFHATYTTNGATIALSASNVVGSKTISIAAPDARIIPGAALAIFNPAPADIQGGIYTVISHTGASPDVVTLDRAVVCAWTAATAVQPLTSYPKDIILEGHRARFHGVGQGWLQWEYGYNMHYSGIDCDNSAMTAAVGVALNLDAGSRYVSGRDCTIGNKVGVMAGPSGFGLQGCEDWFIEGCKSENSNAYGFLAVDCPHGEIKSSVAANNITGVRLTTAAGGSVGCKDVWLTDLDIHGNITIGGSVGVGLSVHVADRALVRNCRIRDNTNACILYTYGLNTEFIGGTIGADPTLIAQYPGVTGTKIDGQLTFFEETFVDYRDYFLGASSANRPGLTETTGTVAVAYRKAIYTPGSTETLLACSDGANGWKVQTVDTAANTATDTFSGVGTAISANPSVTHSRLDLGEIILVIFTMGKGANLAKAYCAGLEGTAGDSTSLNEPNPTAIAFGNGTAAVGLNNPVSQSVIGFATARASLTDAQVATIVGIARASGPEAALLAVAAYTTGLCYLTADYPLTARVGTGPTLAAQWGVQTRMRKFNPSAAVR